MTVLGFGKGSGPDQERRGGSRRAERPAFKQYNEPHRFSPAAHRLLPPGTAVAAATAGYSANNPKTATPVWVPTNTLPSAETEGAVPG